VVRTWSVPPRLAPVPSRPAARAWSCCRPGLPAR